MGRQHTRQHHHADIAVAVAIENGLVTPIVRRAEAKGLNAISDEMKDLAGRARNGRLKADEITGGSFTISNLGPYGVSAFTAVINPRMRLFLPSQQVKKDPLCAMARSPSRQ